MVLLSDMLCRTSFWEKSAGGKGWVFPICSGIPEQGSRRGGKNHPPLPPWGLLVTQKLYYVA